MLISGESGTGKEIFARALHYLGPRAERPFVPVNCGALPEHLVESEIFGHKRGTFTGAAVDQVGLIREAEGGTLFLDEIDGLTSQAQVKLLRFIEDLSGSPEQAAVVTITETMVGGGQSTPWLRWRTN